MKIDNPYHNPFCDHKTHRDTLPLTPLFCCHRCNMCNATTHNTPSVAISSRLKEYFPCPQTIRRPTHHAISHYFPPCHAIVVSLLHERKGQNGKLFQTELCVSKVKTAKRD